MTCNDQLLRNVFMVCQMCILPGSEKFQHNLAQNFDPVAPLLLAFFHSVWEKLWLLTANSHLWIEKEVKNLIFFPSRGAEAGVEARRDITAVSCHPSWNPEDSSCVPRKCVPAWPGHTVLQFGGAGGQKAPWVHSTLMWGCCPDLGPHCTRTVPGTDGRVLPKRWLRARWAWAPPSASLLPPVQQGQHLLACRDIPAAPGGVQAWMHPPRENHSPRSPWQMSVLVAPPRINLGSSTMSWESGRETQKLLRTCQESITVTLSPDMQQGVCHVNCVILKQCSHHKN